MSSLETSVTLDDVLTVVKSKRVPLAPELAGYLLLAIADATLPTDGALEPPSIYISDEGTVAIVRTRKEAAASTDDVERSIRSTLLALLEASGSQTPALGAIARKKETAGLADMLRELEAALIPANRAAGRRALARMSREVKRVTQGVGRNASAPPPAPAPKPSSSPPPSGSDDVDNLLSSFEVAGAETDKAISKELKAMVGLEPTPPPPAGPIGRPSDSLPLSPKPPVSSEPPSSSSRRSSIPPPSSSSRDGVEDLLALAESSAPVSTRSSKPPPAVAKRSSFPPQSVDEVKAIAAKQRVPFPSNDPTPRPPRSLTPAGYDEPRAPKTAMALVLLAIGALVAAAVVLIRMSPGFLVGRTAEQVDKERREHEALVAERNAKEAAQRCHATVVVSSAPSGAEVLLRVGQAPVDVERMPVGTRLEFVATAEGYAPKRTVVPAGAAWDNGADGKPRYEVAVQLDPSKSKGVDPWPVGEPGTEVGGKGAPGTVHVVATPKGAELWLLAGIGPDAKLEQLRCDADVEILVAGPSAKRTRLKASAKEVESAPLDASGAKTLTLVVK